MAIRYYLRDATGTNVEVTGRVRALSADFSVNAEEGSVGMFRVEFDDPDGTFRVGGHRGFSVNEDEAPLGDQRVVSGYTQERTIGRGDLVEALGTGGRVIAVDVADLNTVLSRRVMTGSDANRPAESDVARMQWAVLTNEASLIDDSRYLSTASPVLMDAADYRGQPLTNILEDCAEASGKNYFLTWFGGGDTFAFSLAYFRAGDAIWDSTARLTNVAADVDDTTTFIVSSADLTQSPMRVFSGIYGMGDGITDYRQRGGTATDFARRDTIMSFPNVKSAARLTARLDRLLPSLANEEYRVAVEFFVRPADVNRVRPGMRVQARFSHLPEIGSGYVWLRMLSRQVSQDQDETGFAFYRISGVFSAQASACAGGAYAETAGGSYPPLHDNGSGTGTTNGVVYYCAAGYAYPVVPTPGHVGAWPFPVWGFGGTPDRSETAYWEPSGSQLRLIVVGDGSMTFEMSSTGGTETFNWQLLHGPESGGVIDASGTGSAGTPVVVPVSSHSGAQCVHRIVVSRAGATSSTYFGFAGSTWTPIG